jgi:hypothetical protein
MSHTIATVDRRPVNDPPLPTACDETVAAD